MLSSAGTQALEDYIRQAVVDEIVQHGVHRATAASIAKRAGISRVTLYRKAGTMERLILDALTAEIGTLLWMSAQEASGDNDLEILVDTIVRFARAMSEDPMIVAILEHDPDLVTPYLISRTGGSRRVLIDASVAYLTYIADDGTVDTENPEEKGFIITQLCVPYALSRPIVEEGVGAERGFEILRVLLMNYLSTGNPAEDNPSNPS